MKPMEPMVLIRRPLLASSSSRLLGPNVLEPKVAPNSRGRGACAEIFTLRSIFFGSLEVMSRTALLLALTTVGVKVTSMAQVSPLLTVAQWLAMEKSPALSPERVASETTRSLRPVFFTVTVFVAEVVPAASLLKLTDAGAAEIFGGGACPVSFTFRSCFFGSSEVMARTAFFLP